MIKDRRYHLKTYKQAFKGDEMVGWLVDNKHATSRVEASAIGCSLLMHGVIHHGERGDVFRCTALPRRVRKGLFVVMRAFPVRVLLGGSWKLTDTLGGLVAFVVCDDHNFKDEALFFRFRKDDDTYKGNQRYFRQVLQDVPLSRGCCLPRAPQMLRYRVPLTCHLVTSHALMRRVPPSRRRAWRPCDCRVFCAPSSH